MSNAPRILTLTGCPHPRAEVQSLDAAAGLLVFAWLDAADNRVDSGGSVARFEPQIVTPATEAEPAVYAEPSDEALAAAIAAALIDPPAPVPAAISRARFIIALRKVLGLTEGHVFALISGLPVEQQDDARDLWENAQEFRRNNAFVAALAALNGNTDAQVDEVFRTGAALPID